MVKDAIDMEVCLSLFALKFLSLVFSHVSVKSLLSFEKSSAVITFKFGHSMGVQVLV